jgi:hypothetical protein
MASVTFPEALGGNGQTYTDDADPNTGLDGLGYTIRFIPCLQQAVAMGLSAKNDAQAADGFVQQCQTLRQETATDRQAVAEDRAAVEQHLQDAQARIGTTQALIDARDTALAAQAGAEDAETGAVAAQTSAEAARDAAVVSGQVYPDTSAGLTATSDGQYFKTVAANQAGFLTLWRNNAGVATEIETYPSLTGIAQALEQANRKQTRLARSLQRLGDHGQTLHSDFDLDAHGLGTALVGGVQDALDSGELWTTVRETPTLARQHTADGALKYVEVPPDMIAREYNPSIGMYQAQDYVAIENELRWAADLTNSVWGRVRVDVELIDHEIIEGRQVSKIIETATTGVHYIPQPMMWDAKTRTASIIVGAAGRSRGRIRIQDSSGFVGDAIFDLSAVSVSASGAGTATISEDVDGFYRVSLAGFTPVPGSAEFQIWLQDGSGAASYTGDGASGIYIAQAQLVSSSIPGPIIITEDAPVTRASDTNFKTLGAEYTKNGFSASFSFDRPHNLPTARLLVFSDGSITSNSVFVSVTSLNKVSIQIYSAGVSLGSFATEESFTSGSEVLLSVSNKEIIMILDDGAPLTIKRDLPLALLNRLDLGGRGGGAYLNIDGGFSHLTLIPRPLTANQLVELKSL